LALHVTHEKSHWTGH